MFAVDARHLHKRYGSTTAVEDLTLQLSAHEIYGLVGPDGAGKTTTLRLLTGVVRPTCTKDDHQKYGETSIQILGFDLARQTERARVQIGYLPQRFSLYEELTVIENLRFFAEVRGLRARDWRPRCLEILKFVGLDEFLHRRAGYLSGGMKQKLGLAAALVHRPRLLLLDEPTTGVDPVTRQDFWQLIIRLAAGSEETTVLVSTPYMDEASRCGRVGFLRAGSLVAEGTPAALRSRLNGRILELAGSPLFEMRRLVESVSGVENVQMFGDRLHLRVAEGQAQAVMNWLRAEIPAAGGSITRLRQVDPGLEDVFMGLSEATHD